MADFIIVPAGSVGVATLEGGEKAEIIKNGTICNGVSLDGVDSGEGLQKAMDAFNDPERGDAIRKMMDIPDNPELTSFEKAVGIALEPIAKSLDTIGERLTKLEDDPASRPSPQKPKLIERNLEIAKSVATVGDDVEISDAEQATLNKIVGKDGATIDEAEATFRTVIEDSGGRLDSAQVREQQTLLALMGRRGGSRTPVGFGPSADMEVPDVGTQN